MTQNYIVTFTVDQTPEEAFASINNVRGWWTGDIEGRTDTLGDEWTYCYEEAHYSKQKITELIPGKKVVWRVIEANLNFVKDKSEWKGTEITFSISEKDGKTEILFTHLGLVPDYECFGACSDAWSFYIKHSLYNLITKGIGEPGQKANEDKQKTPLIQLDSPKA
jgi:hypothetical protein